ncbi:MAG: hypothetical protein AAFZ65_05855 [Planctomycetota bacterium]
MLSWVLRHRHQLRALYGLPPEPAMAALLALEAPTEGPADAPSVEGPEAPTPRRGLPVVVLAPQRRRA